jgi:hypothetical protein
MQIFIGNKTWLLTLTLGVFIASNLISRKIHSLNTSIMKSEASNGNASCIFDPIHRLVQPISHMIKQSNLLTHVITAVDALMIDIFIFSLSIFYLFTGRNSTILPTMVFFYLVRTVALTLVIFPFPKFYFFENPGIPSFFVNYDRINDFYFSGHTGCTLILIMNSYQNRCKRLLFILVPLFVYTVAVLLLEGIHYTNDIIIGAVCAYSVSRLSYKFRLEVNLFLMKIMGSLAVSVIQSFEIFHNNISFFQFKKKNVKRSKRSDFEASDLTLADN